MEKQKKHNFAVLLMGLVWAIPACSIAKNVEIPSEYEPAYLSTHKDPSKLLFEDSLTGEWQDNWFIDGMNQTLENSEDGLNFAAGTYTYPDDEKRTTEHRKEMSKHHAVLWTKESFEGDILISFECTRVDTSPFGVNIVYIQAQGIGTEEFPQDIYEWRDFRQVAAMGKYYTYMNAIHISYNVGDFTNPSYIRARRYPKNDPIGLKWGMTKLEPDYDDAGAKMIPGKTYIIEIEKTDDTLVFRTFDKENNALLKECRWDTADIHELMMPRVVTEGRIGLRQMSTKQNIYKNFKVYRL